MPWITPIDSPRLLLSRAAFGLVAIAYACEAWSFFAPLNTALFIAMHLATMTLSVALFVRVAQHHAIYMRRAPNWDPMAPRPRVPIVSIGLVVVAVVNLLLMEALSSTAADASDTSSGEFVRVFAGAWAFFGTLVATISPTVERRIAAAQQSMPGRLRSRAT
jgi:hypothetical protein